MQRLRPILVVWLQLRHSYCVPGTPAPVPTVTVGQTLMRGIWERTLSWPAPPPQFPMTRR